MRQPGRMNLEALPNAVRQPLATVAAIATMATGVTLGAPAMAEAHPSGTDPGAPAEVSPQEQDGHDSELIPSLAVGGFLVISGVGAVYTISKTMDRL